MQSPDEELVSQTLAGDRDAFGVLVHKYQDMVYTYALQKVRNEADSQDITQEVFLRAYRHLCKLRHPHQFRSWLYTIMSNECNRWLARVTETRRREIALEDAADDALRVEPAYTAPTEGWQVDLERAIAALPDDNRVAVSMFYMGDCSLTEISEFLGVSVNTARGKLHRARQQLGSAMSEHYGRFVKSHRLKGGFLMQLMEQVRHIPSPTMGFTWSSATVSKTLFSLITALCVLVGLIGARDTAPRGTAGNQFELPASDTNGWMPVVFLASPPFSARSSITGIPAPTGKRPLAASNRAPTEPSRQSIDGTPISANRGAKNTMPQHPAVAARNDDEKLIYSGRVVDSDGGPVPGADVLYSAKLNSSESATRTALDGTFHFEFPRANLNGWNRVRIIATHSLHAIGWQNLPPQSTSDVEIRLGAPTIISGTILNAAGNPIQNAEVWIEYLFTDYSTSGMQEGALEMGAIPIPPVKTKANGEFVFRGLPQAGATIIYTQGPGFAKERHDHVPVDAKGLEFRLKREARIEGRLSYAETGEPVKNATLALLGIPPTKGESRTSVDANGKYQLKNIAPGMYNLYLDEGPEAWTAAAKEFIKIDEGQTVSNINLTLVRGGFITGRVTDRDTDEPIANNIIHVKDAARPESHVLGHGTGTDMNGVYRFRVVPGRTSVSARTPPGYQDIEQLIRYVDIVEAETVTVDFQLSKGVELVGRVLTETGESVAGARVADTGKSRKIYGKSDEQGKFTMDGLRPGQKLILRAEHSGLGLRGRAEVGIHPGASVEIQMEEYHQVKVSGRVVNRTGEPVPLANIILMGWDRELDKGQSTTVALTDGDGWFREIGLIVGDQYIISANAKGYWNAETEEFTATAEMSQITDLVLLPAIDQFFLEGRVTDTSGQPVRGAWIFTEHRLQNWDTVTDQNGDFRFNNLSMGVVMELDISHPEYALHTFKILKTNQRHDLVIVKADGYLAGTVVDDDGKPIEQASVGVEPHKAPSSLFTKVLNRSSTAGYRLPSVSTNGQGAFELKYIRDPIVSISVWGNHSYKIFENVAVNQHNLVLTLPPTEPRPEPDSEQQARREVQQSYYEAVEKRFKTLVKKPAPELAVAEWLSGPAASIRDLKGKTIALFFWDLLGDSENVQWIHLLDILQEVYGDRGLVCIAICPATAEVGEINRQIAEQSLSYSIGKDRPTAFDGAKGETFNQYAVGWRAPFVLINSAGMVTGHARGSELEEQIQALLAD